MSEWICPACGGGFPQDALLEGAFCPWCETAALGDVDELAIQQLTAAKDDLDRREADR